MNELEFDWFVGSALP